MDFFFILIFFNFLFLSSPFWPGIKLALRKYLDYISSCSIVRPHVALMARRLHNKSIQYGGTKRPKHPSASLLPKFQPHPWRHQGVGCSGHITMEEATGSSGTAVQKGTHRVSFRRKAEKNEMAQTEDAMQHRRVYH